MASPGVPSSAELLARIDGRHQELLSKIDELNEQILQALEKAVENPTSQEGA